MIFTIVLQLLELQIPVFLVPLVLGIERKTNFVEPLFSFQAHFALSEACTLIVDPTAQLWDKAWHFTCNARRDK
jgi:hypothetical protein